MCKLLKLSALLLSVILIFSACNSGSVPIEENNTPTNTTPAEDFVMPENIITEAEYRQKVDNLISGNAYERVDNEYVEQLDSLREELYNLIIYNQDTPSFSGTAYYVSPDGNDQNDGKTPETAWATLEKAGYYTLESGDAVLFERGGLWRGTLALQDGVTYAAYGTGHKPKIYASIDGKTFAEWVETDIENVWKLDKRLGTDDIGTIVFNESECGTFMRQFKQLDRNYEYLFNGIASKESRDGFLYLYCDKGNPAEVFDAIEISTASHVATFRHNKENITIYGLELSYGQDYFFTHDITNVTLKYCSFRWSGGQWTGAEILRYGGGGGVWQNCDTIMFEHCYFYQHFDCATSPQYTGDKVSVFKNYRVTDCLIEKSDYGFEYFHSPFAESLYKDIYVGYNIMYDMGGGFGDKRARSTCIKGRQYTPSQNCIIEKNIFDRAQAKSIDLLSLDLNKNPVDDNIFELRNNLYILNRTGLTFAAINSHTFKGDENGFNQYVESGFEKNPIMRIIP